MSVLLNFSETLEQERETAKAKLGDSKFIPVTQGELAGAVIGTVVVAGVVGFGCGAAVYSRGPRKVVNIDGKR